MKLNYENPGDRFEVNFYYDCISVYEKIVLKETITGIEDNKMTFFTQDNVLTLTKIARVLGKVDVVEYDVYGIVHKVTTIHDIVITHLDKRDAITIAKFEHGEIEESLGQRNI